MGLRCNAVKSIIGSDAVRQKPREKDRTSLGEHPSCSKGPSAVCTLSILITIIKPIIVTVIRTRGQRVKKVLVGVSVQILVTYPSYGEKERTSVAWQGSDESS